MHLPYLVEYDQAVRHPTHTHTHADTMGGTPATPIETRLREREAVLCHRTYSSFFSIFFSCPPCTDANPSNALAVSPRCRDRRYCSTDVCSASASTTRGSVCLHSVNKLMCTRLSGIRCTLGYKLIRAPVCWLFFKQSRTVLCVSHNSRVFIIAVASVAVWRCSVVVVE